MLREHQDLPAREMAAARAVPSKLAESLGCALPGLAGPGRVGAEHEQQEGGQQSLSLRVVRIILLCKSANYSGILMLNRETFRISRMRRRKRRTRWIIALASAAAMLLGQADGVAAARSHRGCVSRFRALCSTGALCRSSVERRCREQ